MDSRPFVGFVVLLTVGACGGGSADPPCAPGATPLAGTVGGAAWSFASGAAAPSPVDPAEGVLDFYADAVAFSPTCVPTGGTSTSFVMIRLPSSAVRLGMNEAVDLWFCIKNGNVMAQCGEPGRGVLRIDARDGTTMTAALCGVKGGDQVSGTFMIPDCFP